MRIRPLLFLIVACLPMGAVRAQHYYDDALPAPAFSIGIKGGLSDLWGDVGTRGLASHYFNGQYFSSTHYIGGLMLQYRFTRWLAVSLEGAAGTIYATDAWSRKDASRKGPGSPEYNVYMRNQDTKSTIFEGLLLAEVMPLRALPKSMAASRWPLQPVLMAGIGVFHFNPKTTYIDGSGHTSWVAVQPLHLESEGLGYPGSPDGYSLTRMCIPLGVGLHYDMSARLSIGFEYLLRFTGTDYLDGVSDKYVDPAIFSKFLSESDAAVARQVYNKTGQLDPSATHPVGDIRGNPDNKDFYSTIGFHVAWRLLSRRDRL